MSARIDRICPICGGVYSVYPSELRKGGGKVCSWVCNGIWAITHTKKRDTSIEIAIGRELESRGVVFRKQVPISGAGTVVDFLIEPNIVVYADGDYWHTLPGVPKRDARQNKSLLRLGYKVYRFWEHDIKKSVSGCIDSMRLEEKNVQFRKPSTN
jgi:very-short-patch-repair endonuclease